MISVALVQNKVNVNLLRVCICLCTGASKEIFSIKDYYSRVHGVLTVNKVPPDLVGEKLPQRKAIVAVVKSTPIFLMCVHEQ